MTPQLVPFLREGLVAAVDQQPGSSASARAPLAVKAEVHGTGAPIMASPPRLALAGPGDVTGLHASQITARHPAPGASNVDPAEMAWIEFQRADLPWLFTPYGPSGSHLQPWLALLVLREDEAKLKRVAAEWRVVITDRASLPDLAEAFAWAHAQLPAAAPAGRVPSLAEYRGVAQDARSRILCPRKLGASGRYLACLVPTFQASVRAAFGLEPGAAAAELAPAWAAAGATGATGAAGAPIELPLYAHWEFETGPEGSFESLVRRLKRPSGPLALGRHDLDASSPGSGLPQASAPVVLAQDGALRPESLAPAPSAPALEAAIAGRLGRSGQLVPPTYGTWHAAAAFSSPSAPPWLDALNRDPVRRVAAGLGTRVVQRHQEEFMAACWEQAGAVNEANRQLRLGELAQAACTSLRGRRLQPLRAPADGLALVAFAGPALMRIRFDAGTSFQGAMRRSCLPPIAVSGAARKLLRPGGPLQRRLARSANPDTRAPLPPEAVLDALARSSLPDAPPRPSGARLVSAAALMGSVGPPIPGGRRPSISLAPWLSDSDEGGVIKRPTHPLQAAVAAYSAVVAADRPSACSPLPTVGGAGFAEHLWAAIDPAVTVPRRVRNRIAVPAGLATAGVDLRPILVAPRLPVATAEYLLEISREWLLPGLAGLPLDSLALLQPNAAFIESFFAGLNHEMARELLWRGFPTDQRGTVFDSFWRHGDRVIPKLHTWRSALGSHLAAGQADLTVLVLRGELVRRFPRATVYLHPKDVTTGRPRASTALAPADRVLPSFDRLMEPDTRLVGFAKAPTEVRTAFLVFQELPQALRFGRPALGEHAYMSPSATDDAASFAAACLLPPVRLYFAAATLL